MKTIDGQLVTITVGRYIDPESTTINLPDRYIPVKQASELADVLEQLIQQSSTAQRKFGNLTLKRSEGQVSIEAPTLSCDDSSVFAMDDENVAVMVTEIRKVAGPSFEASTGALIREIHSDSTN